MASFDIDNNYQSDAGINRVIFSSDKPLLEVELNEAQLIQINTSKRLIENLLGNGISNLGAMSYDGTNLTIASGCFITCSGYNIKCTGLTQALAEGETAYLQVWEEVTTYQGTFKTEGNQQSGTNASNTIEDSRLNIETTRRMTVKYTTAKTTQAGRANLALAKISGGLLVKLIPEINLGKLYNNVTNISETLGELNGVVGVEVDLDNNLVTRYGDNAYWTPGANYNACDTYAKRVRVNVTDAGVIVAKYGDAGYTDTGALTVAITGTDSVTYPIGTKVQSMVWQPKFYYKRVPVKLTKQTNATYPVKGYHLSKFRDLICPYPRPGFKVHPAFIQNGVELDGYLIGQYEGCIYDTSSNVYDIADNVTADFTASTGDKLSSIAGAKPASGVSNNLTRANVRTLCSNRGSSYQQLDLVIASAEQMLFLIEYSTLNIQSTIFGNGISGITDDGISNLSVPNPSNTTLSNGSGVITTTYNSVSYSVPVYRGVCNPYGNLWKFVDGFIRKNSSPTDCNESFWADNTYSDTITASFKASGFSTSPIEGYSKSFGYSTDCDFTYLTSLVGGDSTKPVGDYYYVTMSSNLYVSRLGGNWTDGSRAGLFCCDVNNNSTNKSRYVGCRLCRRGTVTYATSL